MAGTLVFMAHTHSSYRQYGCMEYSWYDIMNEWVYGDMNILKYNVGGSGM